MRIFVTGATGFVGSAVVQELLRAGHEVLGLARSDAAARSLVCSGAKVHRGDLTDLDSLRWGAAAAEGVVHMGFIHDFARFQEVCEIDRRAIEALGSALVGTDRPILITSGTALVASDDLAVETGVPTSKLPRAVSERAAATVATWGVRVSVVRLPPTVHGDGDHGFVPHLIKLAREKGASAYIGDGRNRWPAVHRLDAAALYRGALERTGPGATLHAVAEEGVAFRDIADAIGKGLGLPVVSKHAAEVADHFGWFAHFAALNNPSSSRQTREQLSWHPSHRGLLEDLALGDYFRP